MNPLPTLIEPAPWFFEKYRGQWVITHYSNQMFDPKLVIGNSVRARRWRCNDKKLVKLTGLVKQKPAKKHGNWISRWSFEGLEPV